MVDLIDDRAHRVDRFAGGVFEIPVEVALGGIQPAGVAAAHGDDDVDGSGRLVSERFGNSWLRSRPRSRRVGDGRRAARARRPPSYVGRPDVAVMRVSSATPLAVRRSTVPALVVWRPASATMSVSCSGV